MDQQFFEIYEPLRVEQKVCEEKAAKAATLQNASQSVGADFDCKGSVLEYQKP